MIAAETLAELVTGNLRPDPSDPAAYLADVGQRAAYSGDEGPPFRSMPVFDSG
jgi:hypothetical protein